jgi:ATP-dependent Clp protease ATP-binding subunit ClpB
MTSNIGAHLIQEEFALLTDINREEVIAKTKLQVFDLLKKTIRPEFLNRIDELIMFTPLNREEVRSIVEIQFKSIQKNLTDMGIEMSATEEALDWLAELGYDPQFGARPLKRVMQKKVLNELSKQILSGKVNKDSVILLSKENNELVFQNVNDINITA